MTSYLVAYDLRKEESSVDYKKLKDELLRLGGHKTQLSYWLVPSSMTAGNLHDHIRKFLDDNDALFVSELVKNNHYSKSLNGTNAWIEKHPPSR